MGIFRFRIWETAWGLPITGLPKFQTGSSHAIGHPLVRRGHDQEFSAGQLVNPVSVPVFLGGRTGCSPQLTRHGVLNKPGDQSVAERKRVRL